jgi:hypothetical protein
MKSCLADFPPMDWRKLLVTLWRKSQHSFSDGRIVDFSASGELASLPFAYEVAL